MSVALATPVKAAPVAGDGLLHPLVLASIAVLILNDHVLKAAAPGLLTGKLSDFSGLVFFPLFLQGLAEVVLATLRRWRRPSERMLVVSVVLTGGVFAAIKTIPAANSGVAELMGTAQWLVGQLTLQGPAAIVPVSIALDATDLIALPMLALAYALGARRAREVHT